MKFTVSISIERDDNLKHDDESWFDTEHMAQEISHKLSPWLEDIDYQVIDYSVTTFDIT